MSKLIKINKSFDFSKTFWDLNPSLIYMKPFSLLYNSDTTKNKEVSSKQMWFVFFMEDPDEEENKFFRIPSQDREQMLKETMLENIDVETSEVKLCREQYNVLCLDAIERTLKEQKEHLLRRSKSLTELPYNLNTMKDIDTAYSKNLKIYEDFKRIETLFNQSKKEQTARGGRQLTMSEKKLL